MKKAVLINSLVAACVVMTPGVLLPYIKQPENLTFGSALFALAGIGLLGGFFYCCDSTVSKAQITPNNTPLPWFMAPALWIGVPMLGLCIYVIAH